MPPVRVNTVIYIDLEYNNNINFNQNPLTG
jgi:hypothetical protein